MNRALSSMEDIILRLEELYKYIEMIEAAVVAVGKGRATGRSERGRRGTAPMSVASLSLACAPLSMICTKVP